MHKQYKVFLEKRDFDVCHGPFFDGVDSREIRCLNLNGLIRVYISVILIV